MLMPIHRLARLSDIIFAVAMTILAVVFEPVALDNLSSDNITQVLLQELPDLQIYAITFVTVAFYWFTHVNQFKYYQKTDAIHTFLILFSLMFVVLLPYASNLLESYENVFAINVFYSLSAAGIGTFATAAWIYGTQNKRLVADDLSATTIREVRQEGFVEPILYGVALIPGYFVPWGWNLTVTVGFVIFIVVGFLTSREDNQQA